MGKWHVSLTFDNGEELESDYTFDSEEDAMEEGVQMRSDYHQGCEILNMSNPGDYPLDDVDPDPEINTWKD